MKQLLQFPSSGTTEVAEVPTPALKPGTVLVRNHASLISIGTERSAVDFSRKNLLGKAMARPELVKKVLDKAWKDGVLSAWDTAQTRLDEPLALGYSCAGRVVSVAADVTEFSTRDVVSCAGAGHASHAEVVRVPRNLVSRVPEGVSVEHAAFATVGSVGLHGLRLAEPTLGETVAVIGLGLIGLMTVQMIRAAGCHVLGVDLDVKRVALARELGADAAVTPDEAEDAALALTAGRGVDAVLITAGTPSSDPVELAAALCRDRGRVIAVGAVGMDIPRRPFYYKELSFRVSRSYGPGRYDPSYEENGVDYPIGFVRWTEGRNLGAFLDMVARGDVQLEPLITHRFPIDQAPEAYELVAGGTSAALGIVLTYPGHHADVGASNGQTVALTTPDVPADETGEIGVGLIGGGKFVTGTLLPAMQPQDSLRLEAVCTTSGSSAAHVAKKFGFRVATTDAAEILSDSSVDLVAIVTPHHLHAGQIVAGLEAGKHVFCEKPPALDEESLAAIVRAYRRSSSEGRSPLFAVGYNRRFAPMAVRMNSFLSPAEGPILAHYRVNAGFIPGDHWVQDPEVGGGRIRGEVCHFVDFLSFLADALPVSVHAVALPDQGLYNEDNVAITIRFSDGSVGGISYTAGGDRALGKERVEVFGGGTSAVLDDFRRLDLYRGGSRTTEKSRFRQDKGHRAEWKAITDVLQKGGPPPIPLESIVATSLSTFAALRSLRSGEVIDVDARAWIADVLKDTDDPDHLSDLA